MDNWKDFVAFHPFYIFKALIGQLFCIVAIWFCLIVSSQLDWGYKFLELYDLTIREYMLAINPVIGYGNINR